MRNHIVIAAVLCLSSALCAQAVLQGVSPAHSITNYIPSGPVTGSFNQPMAAPSSADFVVQSRFGGRVNGVFTGGSTSTLGFQPSSAFRPGDEVLVSLTSALSPSGGGSLSNPASWSFRVRAGAGPADFTQQAYPFGAATDSISGVQLADIDGDRDLDIFCSYIGQSGRVWVNNGGGSYSAGPTFGSASVVGRCVAVGDLDGDGDLDVVQGSQSGLRVYACNAGSFSAGQVLSPTANVPNVALADFDADGDLDVIAAALSSGALVYLNNGAGSFASAGSFGGGQIVDISVADFNGDRSPDIVIANASSTSIVYLNNGSGSFTASSMSLGALTGLSAVCSGNIDGDSDIDVIAIGSNSAYVFNFSAGVFSQTGAFALGNGDYQGRLCDLDGDGDLDLALAVQQGQSGVYMNDGAGNFTAGSPLGPNNNGNLSLAVGDIDGDNDLDVVFACANAHQSSVLLNGTTSTPSGFNPALQSLNPAADATSAPRGGNVQATFTGNANGAGAQNFRVHGGSRGRLAGTYSGNGTPTLGFDPAQDFGAGELVQVTLTGGITTPAGAFAPPATYQFRAATSAGPLVFTGPVASGNPGWSARKVEAGDLDLDGDLDLVVLFDDQPCLVFRQSTGGLFTVGQSFGSGFDQNEDLALGDLDGDGDLDVAVARGGGLSSGEPNTVYLNDGTGSFGNATIFGPGDDRSRSVALGDVDGDGDLDAVVGNTGPNAVYLNNGMGQFGTGLSFGSSGAETHQLALADFNHDGFLDAVCANRTGSGGAQDLVFLNDGTGSLSMVRSIGPASTYSEYLAAGDMDGDGDVDVVICTNTSLQLWLNDGLASFTAGSSQAITFIPRPLALGDIDGDGDLDLFVGPSSPDGARVVRNVGGAFGTNIAVTGPLQHWESLCAADFDGDGDLDLAAASLFSSTGLQVIFHELAAQEATLTAGPGAEPSVQSSIAATPLQLLDFTLGDAGLNDALPTRVSGISLSLSGSSADGNDGAWTLSGPDASAVAGVVQGAVGNQQVVFSNLAIEVLGGAQEIYSIHFALSQTALNSADQCLFQISVNSTALSTLPLSSTFAPSPSVSNPGVQLVVVATKLTILTQPGTPQVPGAGFTVVAGYTDANGNVDVDVFGDVLTATRSDSGSVTQGTAVVSAGLASFTGGSQVVLGLPEAMGVQLVLTDDAAGSMNFSATPVQSSSFDLYSNTADSLLQAGLSTEPTSIDSVAGVLAFIPVLDLAITDQGGDGHSTSITSLEVELFGSSAAGADATWQLDGAGVVGASGVVSGSVGTQKVTFSGLALSVADGSSATVTLSLRLNAALTSTADNDAWQLSIFTTGLTLAASSTTFAAGQPGVGNGPAGLACAIIATEVRVTRQPPVSAIVGSPFDVHLEFTDANGNRDADINGDAVTASRSDGIPMTGTVSVAAASGRAWFSGANALTLAAPGSASLMLVFTDDAAGIDLSAAPANSQSFALVDPGAGSGGESDDDEAARCAGANAASPLMLVLLVLFASIAAARWRTT